MLKKETGFNKDLINIFVALRIHTTQVSPTVGNHYSVKKKIGVNNSHSLYQSRLGW